MEISNIILLVTLISGQSLSCQPKGKNNTSVIENQCALISQNVLDNKIEESYNTNKTTLVETKSGFLDGYYMETMSGRKIFAFEGIPYAEPPTGENRFRDPIPKSPWEGKYQAKSPGHDCLQLNFLQLLTVTGNEDCLSLNVYTPKLPNGTNRHSFPVILFIHGGFFMYGTGRDYGPYYLLSSKNVILVTINYRLGVLGFLSTKDGGNYGLKDQALAIKWVHENIQSFGGDPSKISIVGHSSGAVSVHLQMLATNSVAKGLFSTAISLSGSAFHHWGLQTQTYALKMTEKTSKMMNCPTDAESEILLDCLRRQHPHFLVDSQRWLWDIFLFPVVLYGPVIESRMKNNSFIDDTAENIYSRKQVAKIPFICSSTREEAEFFIVVLIKTGSIGLPTYSFKQYGHIFMDFRNGLKYSREETIAILLEHYFGSQVISYKDQKILGAMSSDRYFHIGNRRALQFHSQVAETYAYIFNFSGPAGVAQKLFEDYTNWGSMHGEDLSVIFNSTFNFKLLKKNDDAMLLSTILVDFLTSFADTGKPQHVAKKELQWTPITDPENLMFLKIGNKDLQMISDPFKERIKVWEYLGIH